MSRELPADRDLAAALEHHVRELAGNIGERHVYRYEALQTAAAYVRAQLGDGAKEHGSEVAGRTVSNLELVVGGDRSRGALVIGAHYDSAPGCPGADDNASGVAVVIELARLARERPPAAEVRFVAFVNEEPPYFQTAQMGSLVYARQLKANGVDVRGMVSIESVGYYTDAPRSQVYPPPFHLFFPDRGNFLGMVSDFASFRLLRQAAAAFRRATRLRLIASPAPADVPGVGWSDHWSFWQQGYRALMVTDTVPYRNPHYHTSRDTPDTLGYQRLAAATRGLWGVVERLTAR
jgi:Zn-dependent M28 family amino/carboxypeptidase